MTRKLPILLLAAGLLSTLAACDSSPTPKLVNMDPPAGSEARLPNWCRFHNGIPCMTWVEPHGDGHALKLAWLDEGWTEPVTVATGNDWFVNWADFPSAIELPSGAILAHWLERTGPGRFHYDIRLSRSDDGGASWLDPITPHLDETLTEHGFVSLFPVGDDEAGLIWLDGRHMIADGMTSDDREEATDHHAHHDDAPGPMTLRAATVDSRLGLNGKSELDGRVCDCCQTSVARTDQTLVAVYRGRDEDETRDIRIARKADGAWSEPGSLYHDGWVIPGCPVNGPAVTARDNQVAAVWYTGADPSPRVQLTFSTDGGNRFSAPARIAGDRVLGHVDVVMPSPERLVTSWLQAGETGSAELMIRTLSVPDLQPGTPFPIAQVGNGRAAGFPRMSVADGRLFIAWTHAGDESHSLRAAEIILP